jgi:hypothetical protein
LPLKNKEALKHFKGRSQDRGQEKFAENLHASPFKKELLMRPLSVRSISMDSTVNVCIEKDTNT